VPRPLVWLILILLALVMVPIAAMTLAVAAIAWMPLTAALAALGVVVLIRWNQQGTVRP
jgi:hypothetical protein